MIEQPQIEETSAAGLVARLYMQGGTRCALAQRFLRRRYSEGVQLAFCYHEDLDYRLQLQRLRQFMTEEPNQ